ncbi:cell division protein SepF [Lachnospiraceae bacterium MD1]|jgi:cell division inhibitor SepF|uniref:Cell division protein SepF n=1 Tax=Variimorphobacter saccharofermentans TaxID=2755051 RepID=A0A839K196_9FIRM|nr:cell division protein SepF [Variimorphobacter saccharofermentans]MBB2182972.1 cell division protein SepF [Variimorphobacter saccharofermentans]
MSILKNFLNSMHLTEDEDEEYEEYLQEETEKERKKAKRAEKREAKQERYEEAMNTQAFAAPPVQTASESRKERMPKMERSTANKVVPIRTTPKGLEVCIMKPTSFEDSQEICDMLLTGRATVINLEGFDDKLAQRTMDFISGSVYAINGKLHRISNCIFIVSPDTVDISGDYLDMIQQNGFEPPTFQSKF